MPIHYGTYKLDGAIKGGATISYAMKDSEKYVFNTLTPAEFTITGSRYYKDWNYDHIDPPPARSHDWTGAVTVTGNCGPLDLVALFKNASTLTSVSFVDCDFVAATRCESMFEGCINLNSVTFSNCYNMFPNSTSFVHMFHNCRVLQFSPIPNMDTSKGIYFQDMFAQCHALYGISEPFLSDLSSARNMEGMFFGCKNVDYVRLHGDTGTSLVYLSHMFDFCEKLNHTTMSIPFKNISGDAIFPDNTGSAASPTGFIDPIMLPLVDQRYPSTGGTNFGTSMFVQVVSQGDPVGFTDRASFIAALATINIPGEYKIISGCFGGEYMGDLFRETGLDYVRFEGFYTPQLRSCSMLFALNDSLIAIDGDIITSNVIEDTSSMFALCQGILNGCSPFGGRTDSVYSCSGMFSDSGFASEGFTMPERVSLASGMFAGAAVTVRTDLVFDDPRFTSIQSCDRMFERCKVSHIIPPSVKRVGISIKEMFADCTITMTNPPDSYWPLYFTDETLNDLIGFMVRIDDPSGSNKQLLHVKCNSRKPLFFDGWTSDDFVSVFGLKVIYIYSNDVVVHTNPVISS